MTFLPCSIQSTNAANWNGRKRRMTTMINRTMGILNEEADELGELCCRIFKIPWDY